MIQNLVFLIHHIQYYEKRTIKYYNKPKLFANEDLLNRTDDKNMGNILKGWSFINKDEEAI